MDKLEKIFEMQGALDKYIADNRNLDFTPDEWVQKKCQAMISEIAENFWLKLILSGGKILKNLIITLLKKKWLIFCTFW